LNATPTPAPGRTVLLRQKLAFARGHKNRGRTARFRERVNKSADVRDFPTIALLPDWIVAADDVQHLIAKAAAILYHQSAIQQELSGAKLAALATVVGEALFDHLCDCDLPDTVGPLGANDLPRPEDLLSIGRNYMDRAMPRELSGRVAGATGDAQARALSDAAYAAVLRSATELS
jgi:hypothetical protein